MARVFLSHSSKDKAFVRRLAQDLRDLGHQPWFDEWEIRVGACIVTEVQKGLAEAHYVVLVLTPEAVASGWVDGEWKNAYWSEISNRRVLVLPILLRSCELPPLLRNKMYADFTGRYELGLARLTQAIDPGIENSQQLEGRTTQHREGHRAPESASATGEMRDEESGASTAASAPSTSTINHNDRYATISSEGPRIMGRPFPELRSDLIARTADKLSSPGDVGILFISGPSRVGKSHLCRSLMGTLVRSHGVEAHTFSVVNDSLPLLRRIAASLFPESQVAAPADLARSFVESNVRRLIHLSNCQDLPVHDVQALESLFTELEAHAWRSVQFLLEARTGNSPHWRAFVKGISNKISGCQKVTVEHLTLGEIVQAVDELFLTVQAERIAGALKKKAGSDPVSLIHTLEYLITHGVLSWIEDGEQEFLTINDDSSFFGRLNQIPDKIASFLRDQIEDYKPRRGEEALKRFPYANRLALLASVGPDFDRIRQATALGITLTDLRSMDFQLIRDGFLVHTGYDTVDFSQDVMRLAAESYGRDNNLFWEVAYSVVETMNEHTARDEVIAGALYHCIRDYRKALLCYRAALELAKAMGDYHLQKTALLGCIKCSDMLQPDSVAQKKERIGWRVEIGWNEMQGGSQKQALDYLDNALSYARELLRHGGHDENKILRRETVRIRQRMLTCLLDRQQIKKCLDLLESLVPTIENTKHLFDTLNRFVLLCYMTGEASSGYTAACWGLALAEKLDQESKSVILSDVGHLLLLQSPRQAAQFWRQCLNTAQELRQQTHAQANCLVADLITTRTSDEKTLHTLFQTVQTQTGTSIQLSRLHMHAGVQSALNTDWENALKHFELAKSHAVAFGLVSDEWEAYNNLGITHIALDNRELARRSFTLAASRVHPMIKECAPKRISAIGMRLVSQARKLEPDVQSTIEQTSFVAPPSSTGLFWILLYNLEQIKHWGVLISLPKDFGISIDTAARGLAYEIIGTELYPLRVSTGQGTLVLALE